MPKKPHTAFRRRRRVIGVALNGTSSVLVSQSAVAPPIMGLFGDRFGGTHHVWVVLP
jgi:hypothetical protein